MRAPVGRHDPTSLSAPPYHTHVQCGTEGKAGDKFGRRAQRHQRARFQRFQQRLIPTSTLAHFSCESLAPRWDRSKIAADVGDIDFDWLESISEGGERVDV